MWPAFSRTKLEWKHATPQQVRRVRETFIRTKLEWKLWGPLSDRKARAAFIRTKPEWKRATQANGWSGCTFPYSRTNPAMERLQLPPLPPRRRVSCFAEVGPRGQGRARQSSCHRTEPLPAPTLRDRPANPRGASPQIDKPRKWQRVPICPTSRAGGTPPSAEPCLHPGPTRACTSMQTEGRRRRRTRLR